MILLSAKYISISLSSFEIPTSDRNERSFTGGVSLQTFCCAVEGTGRHGFLDGMGGPVETILVEADDDDDDDDDDYDVIFFCLFKSCWWCLMVMQILNDFNRRNWDKSD